MRGGRGSKTEEGRKDSVKMKEGERRREKRVRPSTTQEGGGTECRKKISLAFRRASPSSAVLVPPPPLCVSEARCSVSDLQIGPFTGTHTHPTHTHTPRQDELECGKKAIREEQGNVHYCWFLLMFHTDVMTFSQYLCLSSFAFLDLGPSRRDVVREGYLSIFY